MTTTDEQRAMLAAIAANPDDDTVRLGYADYLDGLDDVRTSRSCTMCFDGKQNDCEPGDLSYNEWDCESCQGTGRIYSDIDTANRDWAELIRVQVELPSVLRCGQPAGFRHSMGCHYCDLTKRERELTSHPRLTTAVCPGCGGDGYFGFSTASPICFTCGGTGDLFIDELAEEAKHERPHHWDRGFLIVHAKTNEVMRKVLAEDCQTCSGKKGQPHVCVCSAFRKQEWQPTPWARAIAALPWVMGVELEDKKPTESLTGWWWASTRAVGTNPAGVLPDFLFRMLVDDRYLYTLTRSYSTPEQATRALAYAVMGWVRSFK